MSTAATEIPQFTEIPDIEARDPQVLSPAEQSEQLSGHRWSRFAVLGDSIALGMGDPTEGYLTVTWAERVAAALATQRDDVVYANFAAGQAISIHQVAAEPHGVVEMAVDRLSIDFATLFPRRNDLRTSSRGLGLPLAPAIAYLLLVNSLTLHRHRRRRLGPVAARRSCGQPRRTLTRR